MQNQWLNLQGAIARPHVNLAKSAVTISAQENRAKEEREHRDDFIVVINQRHSDFFVREWTNVPSSLMLIHKFSPIHQIEAKPWQAVSFLHS
jgi:hypothetical protein